MAQAIKLAHRAIYITHPNPRVGCVLVKQGQVIAEGFTQPAGDPHAEAVALAKAGEAAKGATAYVTLEPCSHTGRTPPCADALIKAGVSSVYIAMEDPNPRVSGRGIARLQAAGIEVVSGILESEAIALNPGFIKRMLEGIPFVRLKMATSLDGRTAMASGESQWITGPESRRDVQFWRAQSDAILTGIGTVLVDDPSLTVRLSAEALGIDTKVRQPTRVILDSQLRCPPSAKLLGLPGKTLIYTQNNAPETIQALERAGAEVVLLDSTSHSRAGLSMTAVLSDLAHREINEVHTEAGSRICGSLLEAGLVDELLLYMAPHLLGSDAMGAFHLPQLKTMQDRINLDIKDIRAIGEDWRIIARLGQIER
ncbi:MAG: riboflavin biosynthesis protein RibD [Proteobacteria bacterium]|nr:MAG: riboflavin biosynthesis protein RibD [Pseudomonadota bacterium]